MKTQAHRHIGSTLVLEPPVMAATAPVLSVHDLNSPVSGMPPTAHGVRPVTPAQNDTVAADVLGVSRRLHHSLAQSLRAPTLSEYLANPAANGINPQMDSAMAAGTVNKTAGPTAEKSGPAPRLSTAAVSQLTHSGSEGSIGTESRRQAVSEQTMLRKEAHGHRGALRRVLAALFHRHRNRSHDSGNPQWSTAVQPSTVHDPKEAELVIEPVGQRLDKRQVQAPNTTIIGKDGNRYRLLNSLTPRQEKLLSDVLNGCEPEVEDFVNGRLKVVLGQGAFGSVRLALNEKTQQLVVVKKMMPEYGLEEVKKFKMLDSLPEETRNTIINMEDYAIVPGSNGQLKAYLFEELMNHGDLGGYENAAVLDLPNTALERLDLAMHILELVQNIHDHHTYHRDLKPDNLLRTTEGTIKLGDVGFMSQELYPNDVGGTLTFMPPEVGQPQARADLADAFAIGVMFYQLLGREHPSEDFPPPEPPKNKMQPIENYYLAGHTGFVKACDAALAKNSTGQCSLSSVAYQLMHPDPAKRLTVGVAKNMITQLYEREREVADPTAAAKVAVGQ